MIAKVKDTQTRALYAVLISLPLAAIAWAALASYIAIPLFFLSVAVLMNFDSDAFKTEPLSPVKPQSAQKKSTARSTKVASRGRPRTTQVKTKTQAKAKAKPKLKTKAKTTTTTKAKASTTKPRITSTGGLFAWPELGEFKFEVEEDARFQNALVSLANGSAKAKAVVTANLVPEDNNPDDDRSVRIDINDTTVGYMRRDNARSFRRRLSAKKMKDQTTACGAIVTSRGGQNKVYSVFLDLKPFA